jgi:hypothetical protein
MRFEEANGIPLPWSVASIAALAFVWSAAVPLALPLLFFAFVSPRRGKARAAKQSIAALQTKPTGTMRAALQI